MTTTAIKERPILFSGPMVRAILEGRKTQTRRVIRPEHVDQMELDDDEQFCFMHSPTCGGYCDYACAAEGEVLDGHIGWTPWGSNPSRWGRLWVREAFALARGAGNYEYPSEGWMYFDWDEDTYGPFDPKRSECCTFYRADGNDNLPAEFSMPGGSEIRWRPSIHMPRWASRITLEIESVRVERLKKMTWLDACAEGFGPPPGRHYVDSSETGADRKACFDEVRDLWDKLNKARGYGWNANPWVWVVSFRRVDAASTERLSAQ